MTLEQMVTALPAAVENPAQGIMVVDVRRFVPRTPQNPRPTRHSAELPMLHRVAQAK